MSDRPRTEGDAMRWSLRREAPILAVIGAMLVASLVAWPRVEEPIPMHWNASGEVDGYGGKLEGLLLLPAITAGLYLLLTFLPRVDPARVNYDSFAGTYRLIRLGVVLLMGGVHALVLVTAFGHDVNALVAVSVGVGLLFLVLGNGMGKLRPNFFAGIRTPWTLSSVKSWNATHRWGGWVFMAWGLGFFGVIFVPEEWYFLALMVAGSVATAGLVAYSWWVWRGDTERVPASQSRPAEE